MKNITSCSILTDGSLIFIRQPNLKFLSVYSIHKKDLINHVIWSKSNYISQGDISAFVSRFRIGKSIYAQKF